MQRQQSANTIDGSGFHSFENMNSGRSGTASAARSPNLATAESSSGIVVSLTRLSSFDIISMTCCALGDVVSMMHSHDHLAQNCCLIKRC